MDFIRAFILGVVQAITEFLPISSSAHLILFREWLGFNSIDGLTFDVALHVGTVIALVAYFHKDIRWLLAGFVSSFGRWGEAGAQQRIPFYIILASIPAAAAGFFLDDTIENTFRNPTVIMITLVAGGVLFLLAERMARQEKTLEQLTLAGAMFIGVAQSIALIPGVSRSGITIIAGMSQRLQRAESARFSFLLSIPVMVGAGGLKALGLRNLSLDAHQLSLLAVGTLTSALAGWLVIRLLLRFLRRHGLTGFACYRFALAGVILIWLAL